MRTTYSSIYLSQGNWNKIILSHIYLLENIMKNQCINIHAESLDLMNKSDYLRHEKHDLIIG